LSTNQKSGVQRQPLDREESKSGSQSQQKQLLDREEIAKLEEVQEVMSASIVQVYQIDRQTEYQCCLHVEA